MKKNKLVNGLLQRRDMAGITPLAPRLVRRLSLRTRQKLVDKIHSLYNMFNAIFATLMPKIARLNSGQARYYS